MTEQSNFNQDIDSIFNSNQLVNIIFKTNIDCIVYNDGKEIGTTLKDEPIPYTFTTGEHKVRFVAKNFPGIAEERTISYEKSGTYYIDINLMPTQSGKGKSLWNKLNDYQIFLKRKKS